MACRCIPHTQVPYGSRLFADYLYDFSRLSEFYSHNPFKDESFREAARRIPRDAALRAQLVDVLREQNQRLGASKETFANLDKLANPDCIAVVTGHQAGLFTGPAFGLYKGLTAIRLAEELNRRGMPAVPVYWIASEDHDLEEVNHCFIQDREGS